MVPYCGTTMNAPTATHRRRLLAPKFATVLDRVADLQAAIADLKGMLTPVIDQQAAELLTEVEATLRIDHDYCLPCSDRLGAGTCYDCSTVAADRAEDTRARAEDYGRGYAL